jgi:hypothetical protein
MLLRLLHPMLRPFDRYAFLAPILASIWATTIPVELVERFHLPAYGTSLLGNEVAGRLKPGKITVHKN